jgi:Uma2 family endonuclease
MRGDEKRDTGCVNLMVVIESGYRIVGHAPILPDPPRRAEIMAMVAPLHYTAEMVRHLIRVDRPWPRYEAIHGELLVTPAPRMFHQEIAARLLVELRAYCGRERAGVPFMSPADISWGLPDTLVQPDVFVVPRREARSLDWAAVHHLLLAVEVLSPSSAHADRFTKRRLYQEQGTPLYWLIDADAGRVEVWTPADTVPYMEHERLTWHPEGASAPFTFPLGELFRDI